MRHQGIASVCVLLVLLVTVALGGCQAPGAAQPTPKPAAAPPPPAKAEPTPTKAPAPAPMRLFWSATGIASAQYAYSVAVSKEIHQAVPEVQITVMVSGGAIENAQRMRDGQAQLGNMTTEAASQALGGTEQFRDKPYPGLRMLWYFQQSVFHFVVSQASGVKSLYDLDGKEFNPGLRGSASEKVAEKVLETLGIRAKYYRGDNVDALAAIRDRRIVGYQKAGAPPDPTVLDLQVTLPIRILSFSKEDLAKIKNAIPNVALVSVPAETYKGVPAFDSFATGLGIGADKSVPAELAYKMVKAMWERKADIELAYPAVKGANIPQLTIEMSVSPLHEGAVRYYRELGLKVPDELLPPEVPR